MASHNGLTSHVSRLILYPFRIIKRSIRNHIITRHLKKESAGNDGKYIFSHVTHYFGNAGDTVLSSCVRKCFGKLSSVRRWEITHVRNDVTAGMIDRLNSTDIVVVGGGGLFLPDTHENTISGWQWAIPEEYLLRINVPLVVFSVGYNYFRGHHQTELFRKSICALVKKSSFFGLRNNGSVRAIREILPEDLKDKVIYQPCTTTLIRKIFGNKKPEPGRCVAFNMAFDREKMRFGDNQEVILRQVALSAKAIEKKGYRIFYVCHCADDKRFIQYLNAEGVSFRVMDFTKDFPPRFHDSIINFYNDMDMVLGMRGHSQMIPFGCGTEIISLGTHDKMLWFLEDIEAEDWYVELTKNPDSLSETITGKFEEIHEKNHEATHERLMCQQEKLWDITCKNIEFINGLL